jgi:hypothetical protein
VPFTLKVSPTEPSFWILTKNFCLPPICTHAETRSPAALAL